jgi:microfibrillar-associated protein 1
MSDLQPDVDDTDHLDPEAEFNAWRARELARLLREKQAQAAKDEEEAEIERRRAMPEDQRLAEDMAYAEETRNQDKTQMGFLQKYYHKGAFYAVRLASASWILTRPRHWWYGPD